MPKTTEQNFKEELKGDNKLVVQMFTQSFFQIRVAARDKASVSLFASGIKRIASFSTNRKRDGKRS